MKSARILVVVIGVLLPYAARLPGVLIEGPDWLTSYFCGGVLGLYYFGAFNAICWGAILLATRTYRSAESVMYPAVMGFVPLALGHMFLDLSSGAQATIGLFLVPIYTLPFVFVGWLVGRRSEKN